MPDITSLVPPKTDQPSPQQLPARGVVVAAPAALTDPTLTVVVPSHSTTYSLDLRWIRQGAAIPAAGADCKVVFDETGEGIVVWWAGVFRASAAAGPLGTLTTSATSATALTGGPSITIPTAGHWLVRHGAFVQSQATGLFQGNVQVAKNGTGVGTAAMFVGQTQFDGATVSIENTLTLAADDVLTLVVFGNNSISTAYSSGTLSAFPLN